MGYNKGSSAIKKQFFIVYVGSQAIGVIQSQPKMWEEEGASLMINWGDKIVHSKIAKFEVVDMNVTKDNWEYLDNLVGTEQTIKFADLSLETEYSIENVILNMNTTITGNRINTVTLFGENSNNLVITELEPEISVSPLSLDLGDVTELTTSDGTDNFTITNDGTKVLNISGITAPTNYEIQWEAEGWGSSIGAKTISVSNSNTVYVRVTPPNVATYAGNIVVSSDDADESSVNVAVTAEGISADTITDYIAYWKLDDNASNTTVTDFAGNYNGTATTNTVNMTTTGVKGVANTAFELNGTNERFTFTKLALTGVNKLTITAWIYISATPTGDNEMIYRRGTLGSNYIALYVKNGTRVLESVVGTSIGNNYVTYSSAVPLDTWTFVCFTINGDTGLMELGMDNVFETNTGGTFANIVDSDIAIDCIGGYPLSNNDMLTGKIDNVRAYTRVLSTAEKVMVYNEESL